MKVLIVFLGLLMINISFLSYHADMDRYVKLQTNLKAAAEEALSHTQSTRRPSTSSTTHQPRITPTSASGTRLSLSPPTPSQARHWYNSQRSIANVVVATNALSHANSSTPANPAPNRATRLSRNAKYRFIHQRVPRRYPFGLPHKKEGRNKSSTLNVFTTE